MANKHIQHVKSNVVNNGSPKLPTTDQILLGEIGINYANGHERMSIKNDAGEIVEFVSKEYVDTSAGQAANVKEVQIGGTTPSGENTIDIFVDTSIDPISVDVYSKQQIDTKVEALQGKDDDIQEKIDNMIVIGENPTTGTDTEIIIDTSESPAIAVYTQAQVDAIIQKLINLNNLIWE